MATKKSAAKENKSLAMLAGDDTSHVNLESTQGNEAVGSEDVQVPRMKLAQFISDEVKRGDPSHIDGCEAGDYFHSVTRKLFGNEIYVINVFYKMMYNVWKDRKNQGGGLVGSYETKMEAEEARNEAATIARIPLDNPKEIEENFQLKPTGVHYLLLIDPETLEVSPIIFDMDSSKLPVSKKWNTTITNLKGERYSHIWKLTSFLDTNDRNEDYYNVVFEDQGFANADLFEEAKIAYDSARRENEQFLEHKRDALALENKEETEE